MKIIQKKLKKAEKSLNNLCSVFEVKLWFLLDYQSYRIKQRKKEKKKEKGTKKKKKKRKKEKKKKKEKEQRKKEKRKDNQFLSFYCFIFVVILISEKEYLKC